MGLQPVLEMDTVMALARGIESSNDHNVIVCTWTKSDVSASYRNYLTVKSPSYNFSPPKGTSTT
jgi:hypothetical protein